MAELSYMGTIDDVVQRYPWNFKLTKKRLEHSLAIQIITGSPVLLNDGYMTLHPVAQQAILDRDGLIWSMINMGYLRVMARGFNRYGLDEMPLVMAEKGGVNSYAELIQKPIWPSLKQALTKLDTRLSTSGYLQPWPAYDASSGFLILAQQLLNHSSADTVGISPIVRNDVFSVFMREFIDCLGTTKRGARSIWEDLAKKYSTDPSVTQKPKKFVKALMNLGNEIYHYNMGVMLSADLKVPITVETQTSSAFDDLLAPTEVLVEEIPLLPRIEVPQVVVTAPPNKLVEILEPDREVYQARRRWIDMQNRYNQLPVAEIRAAGREYARLLAEHLGAHINYKESEGLVNFAIGKLTEVPRAALVGSFVGLGAGAGAVTGIPKLGTLSGLAAGYFITRLQRDVLGTVTKKFRVLVLKNQIIPPDLLASSQLAIAQIISRQVPSAIEIDTSIAQQIANEMTKYESPI